jgi:outer membrane cobalamin receptor
VLASFANAGAQQPGAPSAPVDTLPHVTLDEMVVTGARTAVPLGASVVAVTRLAARDLDRLAGAGFAEALRMVPGFALVDFDGT